jgi:hypothetical protein
MFKFPTPEVGGSKYLRSINGVTSQKTVFFIFNDVKTSDVTPADTDPIAPNFFGFLGVSCRKW